MSTYINTNLLPVLKRYLKRLVSLPFLQQRRFIIFLFFVVLSTAFWFARSLSEEYESNVSYPVKYVNFPEDKVLVGNVPEKLQLRVRAKGFSILRSKMNLNLVPLRFNVNSFSLSNLGTDTLYIITGTVKDVLSAELGNMVILDISPDTLFFPFTGMEVKKVAVKPILDLHDKFYLQQYMQNGHVKVFPETIIISGPGSLVREIRYIQTKPLSFSNLSDTIRINCDLETPEMVTLSQQSVQVTIPVDRYTEVEERLTIAPLNVPDSLSMIAIPGQISATYRICLSNYRKVLNNPLIPRIDYMTIQESDLQRLTVFLADTPDYISNLRFNPEVTEYLITRK